MRFGCVLEAFWMRFGSVLDAFWMRFGCVLDALSALRIPQREKNALFLGKVRFFPVGESVVESVGESIGGSVRDFFWPRPKRTPQQEQKRTFPRKSAFFFPLGDLSGNPLGDPFGPGPNGHPNGSPNGKKTHFS